MLPRTMRGARTAAFAGLLCAALVAGTAEAQVSGTWKLDEDRSDDPFEVLKKTEKRGLLSNVGGGTSGSITVFGVSVPVERPQRNETSDRPVDSAAIVRSGYLLSAVDELKIVLDRKFADVAYDTLRTLTFENGAEIKTGYSTIVASWTTPDRVVLEHALIGGGEISETFERDGTRLKWDVRVKKDGFKTIRISRVFERAAAAPAAQP